MREVDTHYSGFTLTGALVYQFDYDGQGRLMTVTDGDDDITHITRDALGWPTASARARRPRIAV
ncbi:MAG: hypothetical protein ACREV1_12060 [Gammaproteobacteria bacterium]